MDYKTEMRKLIDIVKQQSFDAPLESTLEDLTTLSTAVKDLSDRINTRTKKSLNPNDKVKVKKKSKAKKINPFFTSLLFKAKPFMFNFLISLGTFLIKFFSNMFVVKLFVLYG